VQLAIDVLKWPGMNVAFLFSFFLATALALLALPYAKRRPADKPTTWGEAMLGSVYVFGVLFLAFGVVPHQWIDHADKNLGWTKAKIIYGPFDILKPQAYGGWFPFTMQYEALRDVIVVVIHLFYFGLMIWLWSKWQKRGQTKSTELATSTYGRPLVKKA
jgi:RsiW-degrading membrane proteinase PrsW (M82 family)